MHFSNASLFFCIPTKKTQSKSSKSTIKRRYGYPMKKYAKSMLKAWIKRRLKAKRKGLKKRYKFIMIFKYFFVTLRVDRRNDAYSI